IAHYQKIGENCIRVLALEPGGFSDPLKGTLIVCDLESPSLEYEALSYVWGSGYPKSYIHIDDSPMRIMGALDDALRHLRRKTGARYIWADSICIDQSSIDERNQQVSLMIDVYRTALKVNIWLGLANECSEIGLEFLSFLASDEDFDADPPWTRSSPELLCAGLNDILHRPYFRRIWVVQELVVAKELRVTVGRHGFGWAANSTNRFLTRLKFAEISPGWEQAGLTDVDMMPLVEMVELANMKAVGFQPTVNSLDIMHNMRHRKATDA
ncbi:hypothetical protein MMC29_008218, partial [Sticta canariensis]|nr:hypothetical protein [Sticta canariensis]